MKAPTMKLRLNGKLLNVLQDVKPKSLLVQTTYRVNTEKQLLLFFRRKEVTNNEESTNQYKLSYQNWDKTIAEFRQFLSEMSEDNQVIVVEYENSEYQKIEEDAKKLKSEITKIASKYRNDLTRINIVALEQGANAAIACVRQLQNEQFFEEYRRCTVANVITIAAPIYASKNLINNALKNNLNVIHYGNRNDITQHFISFFNHSHKITDVVATYKNEKILVSFENLKRLFCILLSELLLKNQTIKEINSNVINQYCTDIIADITKQVEIIAGYRLGKLKLSDLLPFDTLLSTMLQAQYQTNEQINAITTEQKSAQFIALPSKVEILNVFCTIVDALSDFISKIVENNQILIKTAKAKAANWNVQEVYTPDKETTVLDIGIEPIIDVAKQKALIEKGILENTIEFDMAEMMGIRLKKLLAEASVRTGRLREMDDNELTKIAEAFWIFILPFHDKAAKQILEFLQKIPITLVDFSVSIARDESVKRLYETLSSEKLSYPQKLQEKLQKLDNKIKKINQIYTKYNHYLLQEDFKHYIFESHNLALAKCYGLIGEVIAQQTKITDYMSSKGYRGIARPDCYDFELIGKSEISNPLNVERKEGQWTIN